MFQTNTNTNNDPGNTNWNKISGRSGQGQGGSGGRGRGGHGGNCRNNSIAKYLFEEKMKDGYLSKLTITKSGHRATQFKKIIGALPIFCADKNYRYIDDIICTNTKLTKANFVPSYLVITQWLSMYHVNLGSVNPIVGLNIPSGARPTCTEMIEKSPIFYPNFQEQVLSDYDQAQRKTRVALVLRIRRYTHGRLA